MSDVDVLIPTWERPAALAVTLACLVGQSFRGVRVVVCEQSEGRDPFAFPEVLAVVRVLRLRGHGVELHRHLPRRGLAEHRQYLLDRVRPRFCLFLDDDVILEGDMLERLRATILEEGCGLVGCGLIGPSFADDVRPEQQGFEPWHGPVQPELVTPGSRVMAGAGGCGILPTGAYRQELPTTVPAREVDAPLVLPVLADAEAGAA